MMRMIMIITKLFTTENVSVTKWLPNTIKQKIKQENQTWQYKTNALSNNSVFIIIRLLCSTCYATCLSMTIVTKHFSNILSYVQVITNRNMVVLEQTFLFEKWSLFGTVCLILFVLLVCLLLTGPLEWLILVTFIV